jgi:hypothetical protein
MKDKPFRKLLGYIAYTVLSYVIVAGFAWRFVLGLEFPLWKIFIAGLLQTVILIIQMLIFNPRQPKITKGDPK